MKNRRTKQLLYQEKKCKRTNGEEKIQRKKKFLLHVRRKEKSNKHFKKKKKKLAPIYRWYLARLREYLAPIKVFTEFSNRSDVSKQLVRKKKKVLMSQNFLL